MQTITYKVNLNVPERIYLDDVLSSLHGTYIMMKGIRQLQEELSFTSEEKVAYGLISSNNVITWTNNQEREFIIVEDVNKEIQDVLKKLDTSGILEHKHISLYEKFIINQIGE
jgi:hypothetical protein